MPKLQMQSPHALSGVGARALLGSAAGEEREGAWRLCLRIACLPPKVHETEGTPTKVADSTPHSKTKAETYYLCSKLLNDNNAFIILIF